MIDSHAHIDTKPFDADRDAVIQRAVEAGVEAIVIPDIEPERRTHLIEVVDTYAMLYRGIGIHPHHVANRTDSELEAIWEGATGNRVVAIGEIGLDYYYDFAPKDIQQHWFREQLRIAKKANLPVIVHNRESDNDVLSIIEEEQDGTLRGVLHCFSSSTEVLQRALDAEFFVSFTGNITFKKSPLADVVANVPDDRFMIETDSPYITPEPHRGKRNEPSFVAYVASKIAEIKGSTMQDVVEKSTKNARTFFGLTMLLLMLASTCAIAQPTPPRDEDYPDDRDWELALDTYYADSVAYEQWIKPRNLGVGFSIGSQTNIEFQHLTQQYDWRATASGDSPSKWILHKPGTEPRRSFSFNGLFSAGFTATYGITNALVVEGTLLYSENRGPAKDFGLDPITTIVAEGLALYSLNPYSKINFVPQAGVVYASINDGALVRTKVGISFGMGLGVNIPTSIGLFYPMFNVRFNYLLGTDSNRVVTRYVNETTGEQYTNSADPSLKSEDRANVGTFFSIPRLTILYYIPM